MMPLLSIIIAESFHDRTAAALPGPSISIRPAVDSKSGAVPQDGVSLLGLELWGSSSFGINCCPLNGSGYTERQEIEFYTPRTDVPLLQTWKAAAARATCT